MYIIMLIFVDILKMGRRKSLDISMKENIIELHDRCVTQQAISCTLKINQSTVCRTISEYKTSDFIIWHNHGGERKRITNCRDVDVSNILYNYFTFCKLNAKLCNWSEKPFINIHISI